MYTRTPHISAWIVSPFGYKPFLPFVVAALLVAVSWPAIAQRSAITVPRNLSELTTLADRIVQGTVVSARVEPHPAYKNLRTVVVSVAIQDTLKGDAAQTFTFRQFIWDPRDVAEAAGYRPGQQLLLFLNRPTLLGLTSPVGLDQGRFHIVPGPSGPTAVNGNGNSTLMSGVVASGNLNLSRLSPHSRTAITQFQSGPMDLAALKESVHSILQNGSSAK